MPVNDWQVESPPADWKAVVRRAMTQNFGWEAAALRYGEVYGDIVRR